MTRYDRRPRREWDEPRGRGRADGIGSVRLIGFVVVLGGSFLLFNRPGESPTQPAGPRVAVDAAIAAPTRAAIASGSAAYTVASSAQLVARIRGDLIVDIALLRRADAQQLIDTGACSDAAVFASRGATDYVACDVNAQGSSRDLAARVRARLASLEGRDVLLDAGLDVPQLSGGEPPATTP